jgi:hypothetical protein
MGEWDEDIEVDPDIDRELTNLHDPAYFGEGLADPGDDSVVSWLLDAGVRPDDEGPGTPSRDLYEHYWLWCRKTDFPYPLPMPGWARDLAGAGFPTTGKHPVTGAAYKPLRLPLV